jgi:hypothetical protein
MKLMKWNVAGIRKWFNRHNEKEAERAEREAVIDKRLKLFERRFMEMKNNLREEASGCLDRWEKISSISDEKHNEVIRRLAESNHITELMNLRLKDFDSLSRLAQTARDDYKNYLEKIDENATGITHRIFERMASIETRMTQLEAGSHEKTGTEDHF